MRVQYVANVVLCGYHLIGFDSLNSPGLMNNVAENSNEHVEYLHTHTHTHHQNVKYGVDTEKPLIPSSSREKRQATTDSKAHHHVAEKDKYQEDGCQPARGGSNLTRECNRIAIDCCFSTLSGLAFPEIALKQLDNTMDSANMHRMDGVGSSK